MRPKATRLFVLMILVNSALLQAQTESSEDTLEEERVSNWPTIFPIDYVHSRFTHLYKFKEDVNDRFGLAWAACTYASRVAHGCAGATNGLALKVLWVKCANKSKVLSALNVVLADVQASECDGFCHVLGPAYCTLASAGLPSNLTLEKPSVSFNNPPDLGD